MLSLGAQTKYEREFRISETLVPSQAKTFVNELSQGVKVKWYIEQNLGKRSIEAKFKLNKKRYSVEFDTDGVIEDVEIEKAFHTLEKPLQQTLHAFFKTRYKRHRIRKIQIQYSGSPKDLLSFFTDTKSDATQGILKRFEIVAKVKSDKTKQEVEFLFSDTGYLLSEAVILRKNADHLEY